MNFGFAFPLNQLHWWIGLGVGVLVALAFVLRGLELRRGTRLAQFVDVRLAPRLLIGHDVRFRKPLLWLTLLGFGFLGLTFAQPRWGQAWEKIHRRSHDIIICLDTSESMRAENPAPNRLERAKQEIVALLDRAPGDQFGLVAFSGTAELMCPLTLDHGYFKSVLSAIDTNSISLEGTDIAAALNECMEAFRSEEEEWEDVPHDSRAIVLLSDGEEVAGDAVAFASDVSRVARIIVIGIGDPRGAEVAYVDPFGRQSRLSALNKPHLSRLDEKTLQRIAAEGRGGYIRSGASNRDVEEVYGFIEQLSTRDAEGDVRLQLVNRFQWPLALAIACFVGEGLWLVLLPRFRDWRMVRDPGDEGRQGYA